MSTNSACGKLVGRGHLLCCDHESAEVIPTLRAMRQPVIEHMGVACGIVVTALLMMTACGSPKSFCAQHPTYDQCEVR